MVKNAVTLKRWRTCSNLFTFSSANDIQNNSPLSIIQEFLITLYSIGLTVIGLYRKCEAGLFQIQIMFLKTSRNHVIC